MCKPASAAFATAESLSPLARAGENEAAADDTTDDVTAVTSATDYQN